MTTPFDAMAVDYDRVWTDSAEGRRQRDAVWREIDRIFQPGEHILDLGCGTGVDAIHLAVRGVRVSAIDASPRMVEITRTKGIDAQQLPIEQLSKLYGRFDGALSNFGALNCVADLASVAERLGRLVKPNGFLVICLLSRWAWSETLRNAIRFRFSVAARRWTGSAEWRGMVVHYPSRRDVERAFATHFALERTTLIGGGDHRLYVFMRRDRCWA